MNWKDALSKAIRKEPDRVPKGYFTRDQLSKIHGFPKTSLQRRLSGLVKLGLVDVKSFSLAMEDGRLRKVQHYKLKG